MSRRSGGKGKPKSHELQLEIDRLEKERLIQLKHVEELSMKPEWSVILDNRAKYNAKINDNIDEEIDACRQYHSASVSRATTRHRKPPAGRLQLDEVPPPPAACRGKKRAYSESSSSIDLSDQDDHIPTEATKVAARHDAEHSSAPDDTDEDTEITYHKGVARRRQPLESGSSTSDDTAEDDKDSKQTRKADYRNEPVVYGSSNDDASDSDDEVANQKPRAHGRRQVNCTSSEDEDADIFSRGKTGDESEDADDYDLVRGPEVVNAKEKIRKSNLAMAMQGFRSTGNQLKSDKSSGGSKRKAAPSFHPDEVKFRGRIFYRGSCYQYKDQGVDIIVGIKRFVSQSQALCVLVVPFEDTFLGAEEAGVDYKADFRSVSHCQVSEHVSVMDLNHFAHTAPGLKSVPEWVYDPQTEGTWNRFGYFLDDRYAWRHGGPGPKNKTDRIKRKGRRKTLRVLELFAGAGGMHLGFQKAGFTTVEAVDNDIFATATMKKNCHGVTVIHCDVREYLEKYQDPQWRRLLGRIDHIVITPPCQGFSGANRNGGQNDKQNNDLSMLVVDAVRRFRPASVTFENVRGIWRRKHVHYLRNIAKELMKLGYQVRVSELRACDYGSAQIRPRVILFATHRSCPPPKIPDKTHGDEAGLLPYVTVEDVLSALDDGTDSLGNSLHNTLHATTSKKAGEDGVVWLDPTGLAPAIRASGTPPLHYAYDRCISVRECATLQDFPTTFVFSGSTLKQQYRQVGNAVPVEFATKIAQAVREILLFEYEEITL